MEYHPADYQFSLGQVARILCFGREPDEATLHRLRYFRELEVPFAKLEGKGRGHRLTYNYQHLIECGIAIESVRRGVRPKTAADLIKEKREYLYDLARALLDGVDPKVFRKIYSAGDKLLSSLPGTTMLRIHERTKTDPATLLELDMNMMQKRKGEPDYRAQFEKFALNYEGGLIPLQQLITTWLAWAQVVPETKPGPQ